MAVQIVKTGKRTYSHSISSTPRMSSGMSPSSSKADIVPVLDQAAITLPDLQTSGLLQGNTAGWALHLQQPPQALLCRTSGRIASVLSL